MDASCGPREISVRALNRTFNVAITEYSTVAEVAEQVVQQIT